VEEEEATARLSIFDTCLTDGSNVAILWCGPEVYKSTTIISANANYDEKRIFKCFDIKHQKFSFFFPTKVFLYRVRQFHFRKTNLFD
jgi:hypothetical protein